MYVYSENDGYEYYVGLTSNGRIAVALSQSGTDLPDLSYVTTISEETKGPRIVYMEP